MQGAGAKRKRHPSRRRIPQPTARVSHAVCPLVTQGCRGAVCRQETRNVNESDPPASAVPSRQRRLASRLSVVMSPRLITRRVSIIVVRRHAVPSGCVRRNIRWSRRAVHIRPCSRPTPNAPRVAGRRSRSFRKSENRPRLTRSSARVRCVAWGSPHPHPAPHPRRNRCKVPRVVRATIIDLTLPNHFDAEDM